MIRYLDDGWKVGGEVKLRAGGFDMENLLRGATSGSPKWQ